MRRYTLSQHVKDIADSYVNDDAGLDYLESALAFAFKDAAPAELIRFDRRRAQRVPTANSVQASA